MQDPNVKLQVLATICASNNQYSPSELFEAAKALYEWVTEGMEEETKTADLFEIH
jgi:hypothetical protein